MINIMDQTLRCTYTYTCDSSHLPSANERDREAEQKEKDRDTGRHEPAAAYQRIQEPVNRGHSVYIFCTRVGTHFYVTQDGRYVRPALSPAKQIDRQRAQRERLYLRGSETPFYVSLRICVLYYITAYDSYYAYTHTYMRIHFLRHNFVDMYWHNTFTSDKQPRGQCVLPYQRLITELVSVCVDQLVRITGTTGAL